MRNLNPLRFRAETADRVLDFDTENVPGFYWYDGKTSDILHTIAWTWLGEDTVESVTTVWNPEVGLQLEQGGFERFLAALTLATVVTGHNIKRHDIPLLNAHAVRHQLPPIQWPTAHDTLLMFPPMKGMPRGQEYLADLYALEERKMHVGIHLWEKASRGDREASKVVVDRCKSDVVSHAKLYSRLMEVL